MQEEKVLASYWGNCPESIQPSEDYLSTTRKTTPVPVGEQTLWGGRRTIYVQPHIWQLPIFLLYKLRTTFGRTDSDALYRVMAAATMTSLYIRKNNYLRPVRPVHLMLCTLTMSTATLDVVPAQGHVRKSTPWTRDVQVRSWIK